MATSPIIIIGMHRSGTTMTTRLLEELGLFVGDQKRKNYEAVFFQELNRWMMAQSNTSWDFPTNYRFVDRFYLDQVKRVAGQHFASLRRAKFLGRGKTLRYKSLFSIDFPWCWKDPLNTITLDTWMELFPDAKVLHIYRNPIDVAASLHTRELRKQERWELSGKKKIKERTLSHRWLYNQSCRVLDVAEGVALWEEYLALAEQHEQRYADQTLSVQYESLLEEPSKWLAEVAAFCNLTPTEAAIAAAAAQVDSSRKYAFKGNAELEALYASVKANPLVQRLGYGAL